LRAKANSRRARLELTAAPPAARREFRGILIGIAATYLLGFGAEPISTMDDQVMLAAAMNFVHTGKLTVPDRFAEATPGRALFGRTTAAGEVYVKYPPGYPLVLAALRGTVGVPRKALSSDAARV